MRGLSRRKFVEIDQADEIVINNFLFEFIKTWIKPFTISDLCFNLNLKKGNWCSLSQNKRNYQKQILYELQKN